MEKIQYFLYARKSTESEDRQVASIESQMQELKKIARNDGLEIIEILTESKSAKAPGRPIFNKMIERIQKQEAYGILCWKLDRLARNPVDGGQIQWMLQQGIIKHIRTYERSYYPEDNVLVMCVELGMANQYIRDLSLNIKRGIRNRAEKGWHIGLAPMGYLNTKIEENGHRKIIKDPERFDLVRKMWDLLLEKHYSIEKIYKIAINKLGLTLYTGKKPCLSKIYHTFTNPFYYGYFRYKGEIYKGNHEPMITKQEFDKAQVLLGNKKPQPLTHTFAFTGLIRCGECGAMITAEEKTKHQKNGNTHHYTYYHCTKKKDPNCSQKCITDKELEKQILQVLDTIKIPYEFHEWAMKQLRLENKEESESRDKILEN